MAKEQCSIDTATNKLLADMSSNNNAPVPYDLMEKKQPKEDTKGLVDYILSLDTHPKTFPKPLYNTDIKSVNKEFKKRNGIKEKSNKQKVSQVYSTMFVRTSEMMEDTHLKKVTNNIINDYQDFFNKYVVALKKASDEGLSLENLQSFEHYTGTLLGWDKKNGRFKEDSIYVKYNDDLIKSIKNDENNAYNYFSNWINNYLTEQKRPEHAGETLIVDVTRNIRTNLLKNSLPSALINLSQLSTTILPGISEHGFKYAPTALKYWGKGFASIFNESALSEEELAEAKEQNLANQTAYDTINELLEKETEKPLIGKDLFMLAEKPNQYAVYFTAKKIALDKGMSEKEAKEFALKENEKLNFINRAGNAPQAYWNPMGQSALALMTYTMQFIRMDLTVSKNIGLGLISALGKDAKSEKNREKGQKAIKHALTYLAGNLLLFGPLALKTPTVALLILAMSLLGFDDEKFYDELKEGWQGVISETLHLDFASRLITDRINLIPLSFSFIGGIAESITWFAEDFIKIQKGEKDWDEKTTKKLTNAIMNSAGITSIGAKLGIGAQEIKRVVEAIRRVAEKDYARMDWDTKRRYKTNAIQEIVKVFAPRTTGELRKTITSESSRNEKKAKFVRIKMRDAFIEKNRENYIKHRKRYKELSGDSNKDIKSYLKRSIGSIQRGKIDELLDLYEKDYNLYKKEAKKVLKKYYNNDKEEFRKDLEKRFEKRTNE